MQPLCLSTCLPGSAEANADFTRDFLLFMPNQDSSATLHAVFSFYSDIVTLNSEGDSVLSDDTLQGIGMMTKSLMLVLFGSIIRIAFPQNRHRGQVAGASSTTTGSSQPAGHFQESVEERSSEEQVLSQLDGPAFEDGGVKAIDNQHEHVTVTAATKTLKGTKAPAAATTPDSGIEPELDEEALAEETSLIKYLPDVGYFVAGAVAGGVSRTCTAPLDRLKVYLLVNTKSTSVAAVDAAKSGRPVLALTNAGKSFLRACKELWGYGGFRGLYAGMYTHTTPTTSDTPSSLLR
jgi:solute carrier family 25 (mitochondrial phosphate transporter), member 23/24/25/41